MYINKQINTQKCPKCEKFCQGSCFLKNGSSASAFGGSSNSSTFSNSFQNGGGGGSSSSSSSLSFQKFQNGSGNGVSSSSSSFNRNLGSSVIPAKQRLSLQSSQDDEELQRILFKISRFSHQTTKSRVCTSWMSGKITDSCRRLPAGAK